MNRGGYFRIGQWRGVPIRVHWSTPLGALLFGGLAVRPGFWVGFVLLLLAHELGHAWMVQRAGAEVLAVELSALGGVCRWSGEVSRMQRACIAWAGVWAQALVFLAAFTVQALAGPPASEMGRELLTVFTRTNAYLAGLNLLPVPPLDGAQAWPLLPMLWRRARSAWKGRQAARRQRLVAERLAQLEAAERGEVPAEAKEAIAQFLAEVRREEPQARAEGKKRQDV